MPKYCYDCGEEIPEGTFLCSTCEAEAERPCFTSYYGGTLEGCVRCRYENTPVCPIYESDADCGRYDVEVANGYGYYDDDGYYIGYKPALGEDV